MASEAFTLAILLTLKDAASGGLDRFASKLRATGKDGEKFAEDFEKIRSELNRDFAIGGVGVAGLSLMSKGVKMAGDFQASMTELRSSFMRVGDDGKVNMSALGNDMLKAEGVAMKLGNTLPGTTEDFVQMMQVLKQNGLGIDTILNGAADAVGNLAVASNAIPREIAADFAQFGNLFKLRAQDFAPAADVFSRIYSSTGQTSAELVEAAKYFQGRAGTALGIGGLEDAEQMTRVFGLMGKQGMRGSMAGMGLTNFFDEYNSHRDKLEDLAKATGIKLDFFDKKGKFVGIDSVIEQMSQFNKLSDSDRSQWMKTMFGTLGSGAGNILANAEAWKQFNVEQDKTIGLAAKNAEISKNFNNQLEALTGSLSNLVVTGFGPLLPSLTSAASGVNNVVGSLVEFAKANPGLMETLGTLGLYGSVALVAYSGIKTLTAGWRLMKLTMAFSRGESAMGFFTETAAASQTAAKGVAGFTSQVKSAEKQVGGLRGSLKTLAGSGAVKIGLNVAAIAGVEFVLSNLVQHWADMAQRSAAVVSNARELQQIYDEIAGSGNVFRAPGDYGNSKSQHQQLANKTIELMKGGRDLEIALRPETRTWFETFYNNSPFGMATDQSQFGGPQFSPQVAKQIWSQDKVGVGLRDPNSLALVLKSLKNDAVFEDRKLTGEEFKLIANAISELVGPEKMAAAMNILGQNAPPKTVNPNAVQFGIPKTPNIYDLPNPWGVRRFDINQPAPMWTPKAETAKPTVPKDARIVDDPRMRDFFKLLGTTPKPAPMDVKMPIDIAQAAKVFDLLQAPLTSTTKVFTDIQKPVVDTTTTFGNLIEPADKLPRKFDSILTSAGRVSASLDILSTSISSWRPPTVSGTTVIGPDGKPIVPPGFAVGGDVTHSGLAIIHAGEKIVPARARKYEEAKSSETKPVVFHYNPTIHVAGGGREAKREFASMLNEHKRELEVIVKRVLQERTARA